MYFTLFSVYKDKTKTDQSLSTFVELHILSVLICVFESKDISYVKSLNVPCNINSCGLQFRNTRYSKVVKLVYFSLKHW